MIKGYKRREGNSGVNHVAHGPAMTVKIQHGNLEEDFHFDAKRTRICSRDLLEVY